MTKPFSDLFRLFAILAASASVAIAANEPPTIESWITLPNRSELLARQAETTSFGQTKNDRLGTIVIDERTEYQGIDGFGFALTGGSAELLMKMSPDARTKALQHLFGRGSDEVGISYLRLTIGASDLNSFVFSYNDLPEGETDFEMQRFDLAQDKNDVIPVMLEILEIAPDIKILASPWSAPAWMKQGGDVRGGHLLSECYPAYSLYFAKYIEAMAEYGIHIDALTIQNEPLNSRNTPSMPWFVEEQSEFLSQHLIPLFQQRGIDAKLVLFDHNCDRPDYPITLLQDSVISEFADGSGFHHYGGSMEGMSTVHHARPDKNIYFTEQLIRERDTNKPFPIASSVRRMIVDVTRNWSRNVILWNLAADPLNDPHTENGGCSMCQGAITIDGDQITQNLAYYTIAHASKFIPEGSRRIHSNQYGDKTVLITNDEQRQETFRATVIENAAILPNVAFKTPSGKIVLVVANDTYDISSFQIQYQGKIARVELPPGAAGTFKWQSK